MRGIAATAAILAAIPAAILAKEPLLNIPLDCELGQNCYINDYFDRDPSGAKRDFRCGLNTRDGHSGVDFALYHLQAMRDGVDVIAAAPGTVRGVRDGMLDIPVDAPNAPNIDGRECGNGVMVDHGGGWMTQYCHLKNGTVAVQRGDRVRLGTILGEVGLSGQTNYPHVHFNVFSDGHKVDPFDTKGGSACNSAAPNSLWHKDISYEPASLLRAGFASTPPTFEAIKDGLQGEATISDEAPVFIAWVQVVNTQAGDEMTVEITGPNGPFLTQTHELERGRRQGMRYFGKRRRDAAWPAGSYTARFILRRGDEVIGMTLTQAEIR